MMLDGERNEDMNHTIDERLLPPGSALQRLSEPLFAGLVTREILRSMLEGVLAGPRLCPVTCGVD